MKLKYYDVEDEIFREEYAITLNDEELTYIFLRLQSRYEFTQYLKIYGRQHTGGRCSSTQIRLPHNCSVGLLAHEVAHALQKRNGDVVRKWHTKKHMVYMKRVCRYIMKNLPYWREVAARGRFHRVVYSRTPAVPYIASAETLARRK